MLIRLCLKSFLLLILLFTTLSVYAQSIDFNNYTPITSSGTLPSEFSTSSTEKYYKSTGVIGRKERRFDKRAKKEFLLNSVFGIDELLSSGKVLFNDPVGNYVDRVFAIVVSAANIDKDNVKVFVVKTNRANAFATDQGYIFITTGLLARLHNEAELAFVLSHELIHFQKKHAMDVFVQAKRTDASIKKLTKEDLEPLLLSKASYSKEKETEADLSGWEIFNKTGYSPHAVNTTFDVLLRSALPFDTASFNGAGLADNSFYWAKSMFNRYVGTAFLDSAENDSFSTHPNISKRKAALRPLVAGEGKDFIVSEQEFGTIRKICRFEYCRLMLLDRNYVDAIYSSYCLLKEDPNSVFLQKIIAKSLYGLSAYNNQGYKNDLRISLLDRNEGIQQASLFFLTMQAPELNTLALKYLWDLKKRLPNDIEIDAMLNDCSFWQAYLHFTNTKTIEYPDVDSALQDFSTFYEIPSRTVLSTDKKKDTAIEKYNDSVKAVYDSLVILDRQNRVHRLRKTFLFLLKDTALNHFYEKSVLIADGERLRVSETIRKNKLRQFSDTGLVRLGVENIFFLRHSKQYFEVKKWEKKQLKKTAKKEFSGRFSSKLKHLQGDKVMVLDPLYREYDFRKEEPTQFINSENDKPAFINKLKESSLAAKVPIDILSTDNITVSEVDILNNATLVREWLEDASMHDNVSLISSEYGAISNLSDSLQTRYLMLTGNVFLIRKKLPLFVPILYSIVAPFISWPITFPEMFKRRMSTSYFFAVIDLKSGELMGDQFSSFYVQNLPDVSYSNLYAFFQEVKLYQKSTTK